MSRHARVMLQVLYAILAMIASGSLAFAQGKPVIRVTLQPSGPVVVGQQVRVTVQVLVPNYFLGAPDWPTLDIEGAVVTMPDEVMPHLTETSGGDSYAGVQKIYVIAPQQEGEIALPPVEIHVKYAAVPGQPPADGVVTLPVTRITARWPEGAHTDEGVLPVARLTVHQRLDRKTTTVKVGETLTRTITTVAAHAQAMMILPPALTAPDGVRLYHSDPALTSDVGIHGELNAGRRVDKVTYLFEKPGRYTLPAIDFPWFDAARNAREVASAPEVVVDVAAAAAAALAIAPEAPPPVASPPAQSPWLLWKQRLPWVLGVIAALWLVFRLWRSLWPRYRAWSVARRISREHSEPTYFARFERACAVNDTAAAYAALTRWAQCAGHGTIESWCRQLADDQFTAEVTALNRSLFAATNVPGAWSGKELSRHASRARARWLDRLRQESSNRRSSLPALNPFL